MNHFIELIGRCIPGSEEALEIVKPYIKVKQFRKDDLILQAGTICQKASFISKGGCIMYRNMGGKEEVTDFFFERMLIGDYVSFIKQAPTEHDIKVLEDSEIEEISHADLRLLYGTLPPMERVGRILSEQIYCTVITRMLSYQNDCPEVRYQKLIEERPELLQRVPQYLIASYLGVTPVGLSKIRKRMQEK